MPREAFLPHLHPTFRHILVDKLEPDLSAAGVPLKLYEAARSPFRQAELFSLGRATGSRGKTVTKARAWESFHQFGLGADYVFFIDGRWTWEEPEDGMWKEYQIRAARLGLRVLSIERPHVELPVNLSDLQGARFPGGGDNTWRDWMETQAELWGGAARDVNGITHPGAPPGLIVCDRPAMDVA